MTGSVQIKKGKYWISLNKNNNDGQRGGQIWINTFLPERGNKKRATELLDELTILEPSAFTNRFVTELKVFVKQHFDKIRDRDVSIPRLFHTFVAEYENKENCGLNVNQSQDMFFHELLLVFIGMKKEYVAQHTHRMYVQAHKNYFFPFFSDPALKVREVRAKNIKDFLRFMKERGLGNNTMRKYYTLLRGALTYAVKKKMILENPTDDVPKPKEQAYSSEFYSKDEINTLLEAAQGTKLETIIMLACYFGFRRSEIIGLKWDAVDFNTNMVSVKNKVLMYYDEKLGKRILKASTNLKTDTSRRSLPMGNAIRNYLLQVKTQQEKNAEYFGNSYDREWDGYICRHADGKLVKLEYVRSMFPRLLKKNNLKPIRFHDLRHSCATLLLQSGFNMREVQEWMGHAEYSTTAKIYAHVDFKSKANMAFSQDDQIAVLGKQEKDSVQNLCEKEALVDAAKVLLENGLSIGRISEITGISEGEIECLS